MKRAKGSLVLGMVLSLAGAAWGADATWNVDANGNWYDVNNWDPNTTYPNGAAQTATLSNVTTQRRDIFIDGNRTVTVGHVRFSNSQGNEYSITGDGTGLLVFDGSGVDATVTIDANTAELPPVFPGHDPGVEFDTLGVKIRLDSNLVLTNNNVTDQTTFTGWDQAGEFYFGAGGTHLIDLNGHTLTFSGTGAYRSGGITGSGTVVKEGAGNITLHGFDGSDWTGQTYINEGTWLTWISKMGSNTDVTVADGASALFKHDTPNDSNFTISGDGCPTPYGQGALCHLGWQVHGTPYIAMNGTIHMAASSTIRTCECPWGLARFTFNAPITGDPNANLTKTGPGQIYLDAENTYAGDTIISEGEINLLAGGSLANCNISIAAGAKLKGVGTVNYNLVGDVSDLIDVHGILLIPAMTLVVHASGSQSQQEYVIADYSDGTLIVPLFAATFLPDGWSIDYDGTDTYPDCIVLLVPPGLLGDVNGDGNVDNLDITPFVYALVNGEAAFETKYPDGEFWAADCRIDGNIDNLDITPFVNIISAGAQAIPEPATLVLLGAPLAVLLKRKRKSR